LLFLLVPCCAAAQPTFESVVVPYLARHCQGCHSAKTASGNLDLAAFRTVESVDGDPERWEKIARRLEAGEMPPAAVTVGRPGSEETAGVVAWIQSRISRTGRPRVAARRLNRAEYNNTVRDLLGLDLQPANDFPQDDSAYGFDNIADALTVSPLLMEKQLDAAERIARAALFGLNPKPMTHRYEVPVPRRMEVTNPVKLTVPPYFTMSDYDATGLSQPGAFHMTWRAPVEGDYVFQIIGAGNRPAVSDPGEMTFWIDGKLLKTFEVGDVAMSGFERRPDLWEARVRLAGGPHDIVAAFPRQFEGLPPRFRGPRPSSLPQPPLRDPLQAFRELPPDTPPWKIEERRVAIERAKEQLANPRFDGLAVTEVDITGPHDARQGATAESLAAIYTCGHSDGANHAAGCERRILADLARRAFRRAVTPAEVDRLVALSARARQSRNSLAEGLATALQAMLVSPDFLFRIERERDQPAPFELASRLSYFLWSSMPDEELLRSAEDGPLAQGGEALERQVRRMLAHPKSRALVENFAGQWLETRRIESVQPDRDRFPDFDDYLRQSMAGETERFLQHVVTEDRSVVELLNGRYSFLNERLARHYGIQGVTGTEFRKVDLSGTGRAGVLNHASVLTVSSYATRTSPVLRGKWILDNLLNAPPPPPPGDVPALDEKGVGESATLREQLEHHRANAVCASCHARMDPLGFALENYDAVGAWRTHEGQLPIDPSGALPDGRPLQGPAALTEVLEQDRDAFAASVAEKLLTYALGRGLGPSDRAAVRAAVVRAAAHDYRFSALVLGIVDSAPFQGRSSQP
jgi:hypothetical protein